MELSKFAVHEAARDGRASLVESLLKASPRLAELKDDDERQPIHWAVSYSHLEVVRLLVSAKYFDPDVQDGSGWTPLMIAVSLKDGDELIDLLLQKGANVNAKNFNDQTVLHFVASKKNLELARRLLDSKAPASTRIKDKRGQYPIHRAAAVGSTPIVELFIKHKSPLNATDIARQSPLHHAIAEGHGDTAVALLRAGAVADKKDIDGFLPLDRAPDSKVRNFILQSAEREAQSQSNLKDQDPVYSWNVTALMKS